MFRGSCIEYYITPGPIHFYLNLKGQPDIGLDWTGLDLSIARLMQADKKER